MNTKGRDAARAQQIAARFFPFGTDSDRRQLLITAIAQALAEVRAEHDVSDEDGWRRVCQAKDAEIDTLRGTIKDWRAKFAEVRAETAAAWQPFTTAPEDGTSVFVWREDAGVFTAAFLPSYQEGDSSDDHTGDPCWFDGCGDDLTGDLPTYWMPESAIAQPAPERREEPSLREKIRDRSTAEQREEQP